MADKVKGYPLAAILIVAFAARLILIDTSYAFWDEAEYIMDGRLLATGDTPYNTMSYRPPLVPWLLSLFHENESVMRAIFASINTLSVYLMYLLARKLDERAGLIAAAILAVMPFHLLFSHYIMTDSIAMMLVMASVYLYMGDRPWQAYAGGVMLSLAVLCKFTSLAIMIVLIPLFYLKRKNGIHLAGSLLAAALAFSPYMIYNARTFGDPFFPILNGFNIVNIPEPPPYATAASLIFDLLNPMLIAAAIYGIIILRWNKQSLIYIFWLTLMLSIFLILIQRGVDKPPGIEWLTERFLLPAVPPFVALVSYGIGRLKPIAAACLVLIALFAWYPAYSRLFIPAIDLENGLRQVTKDAGTYLKGSDKVIYCRGNCPPIAYYSGKRTSIIYDEGFEVPKDAYLILFDQESSLILEKDFRTRGHIARIYRT